MEAIKKIDMPVPGLAGGRFPVNYDEKDVDKAGTSIQRPGSISQNVIAVF